MSGSIGNVTELKVLEHIVGKTSFTMPSVVAIALATVIPDDTTTGATIVEPSTSGTAYARLVTAGSDWGSAAAGQIANAKQLTFPTPLISWGSIVGAALVTSGSVGAGDILGWFDVPTKLADVGDPPFFDIGALVLTLD